jgi:hypothetical protein
VSGRGRKVIVSSRARGVRGRPPGSRRTPCDARLWRGGRSESWHRCCMFFRYHRQERGPHVSHRPCAPPSRRPRRPRGMRTDRSGWWGSGRPGRLRVRRRGDPGDGGDDHLAGLDLRDLVQTVQRRGGVRPTRRPDRGPPARGGRGRLGRLLLRGAAGRHRLRLQAGLDEPGGSVGRGQLPHCRAGGAGPDRRGGVRPWVRHDRRLHRDERARGVRRVEAEPDRGARPRRREPLEPRPAEGDEHRDRGPPGRQGPAVVGRRTGRGRGADRDRHARRGRSSPPARASSTTTTRAGSRTVGSSRSSRSSPTGGRSSSSASSTTPAPRAGCGTRGPGSRAAGCGPAVRTRSIRTT